MKTRLLLALALAGLPAFALAQENPKDAEHRPEEKQRKESHDDHPNAEAQERLARMKREIGELNRLGKHEEAERLMKQLHGAATEKKMARPGAEKESRKEARKHPVAEGPERIRHLQEAIRHLHSAGLHEPARDLENAAAKMREQMEHHAHSADPRPEGDHAAMREMHRQLQEVREQMRKISQELQQLKEQSRAARPDRE